LSNEADARALMDLGAFAYFAKPFKLEDIEEAVARAIARHQELAAKDQVADQSEHPEPAKTLTGRPKLT
jgi:DNA-binding NtrC family response regulator